MLNWKMNSNNTILKEKNYKALNTSIKSIVFLLLVIIPVFIFAYILYNNDALDEYVKYKPWEVLDVPKGHEMYALFWTGIGFTVMTIIAIGFYKPVATGKNIKRGLEIIYISLVTVMAIGAVLFFALSQYEYSKFIEFYKYESETTETKIESIQELSNVLSNLNKSDSQAFLNWEESVVVWWVMFFQVMSIFAIAVSLQNTMFGKIENEPDYKAYVDTEKNQDTKISTSKFGKTVSNMFKNTDKNIARYMVIVSFIIIIPNLVFSILSTAPGTNINALINWSYKAPTLLRDIKLEDGNVIKNVLDGLDQEKFGSLFPIVSLQLIFIGITISTLFFFTAILIRGKNISNKIFLFQTIILFVELIAVMVLMTVSKAYIYKLSDFWTNKLSQTMSTATPLNAGSDFFAALQVKLGENDYNIIINMFPPKGLDNPNGFNFEWISKSGMIAESIIGIAFTLGSFTIIGYSIYRLGYLDKANRKNYLRGLFNN